TLQTPPAIRNIRRANLSIGQQRLGGRVFQHRHPCRSPIGLLRACVGRLAYLLGKNGYSPTTLPASSARPRARYVSGSWTTGSVICVDAPSIRDRPKREGTPAGCSRLARKVAQASSVG